MASDDTSGGGKPAGPVALRIKLRYDDVEAMVQRFAGNVGRSGLFLPTRSLHPVGTEVKFELRIANDTAVLVGLGKVKAAKAPDPANPKAAFGLAIELMRVTREGRDVIIRLLERRRQLGLPEVAIPMPDDIEAARRMDVDTQPRIEVAAVARGAPVVARETPATARETSATVREAPAAVRETPATVRETSATMREAPATVREAMAMAREASVTVREVPARPPTIPPSEALLTSPRSASGPIATARARAERASAPVLAPEPVRARRPKLAELVAKAAEASDAVAMPELGEQVDIDVGKAIARARVLAGADLDGELEALKEASAVPIAVDIEAASAELARQLGGKAIARRDRSARWAPPPAVATPSAEVAVAVAVVEAAVAIAVASASESESESESESVSESESASASESESESASASGAERSVGRRLPTASGEMDRLAEEQAMAIATRVGGAVHAIEQPDVPPVAEPRPIFGSPMSDEIGTDPAADVERPRALAVDDDDELQAFERALDAARIHTGTAQAAPAPDDEEIAELDADDLEIDEIPGESTQIGAVARGLEEPPPAAAYDPFAHAHPAETAEFAEEEISELDVLAEADADDGDLLVANGERDSSGYPIIDGARGADSLPSDEFEDEGPVPIAGYPRGYGRELGVGHAEPADGDERERSDSGVGYGDGPTGDPVRAPSVTRPVQEPEYPPADAYRDAYGARSVRPKTPTPRDDFAARLDLDDEDDLDDVAAQRRARVPSTGYATAARYPSTSATFDDPNADADGDGDNDFDEPHQYTQTEEPRFEDPEVEFDELHGFSHNTPSPGTQLDHALSALDVDLEPLEVPPNRRRPVPRARPLPGMPPSRASRASEAPIARPSPSGLKPVAPRGQPTRARRSAEDDGGVLIDFDDDDDE